MAGPAGYRRSDDPSRLRLGGAHANGNSATHAIAPPHPQADGYPAPTPTPTATTVPTPTATPEPTPVPRSSESDREALIALYHATDGPNWTHSENWLSDKPIGEWFGVTCDGNDRVTSLMLRNNWLSGELPPELGQLSRLQELYLNGNRLVGSIRARWEIWTTLSTCTSTEPAERRAAAGAR